MINTAAERAADPLKIGVKTVSEVIDADLLAILQNEIEDRNKRLIIAFRTSGIDDLERSRLAEESRRKICSFLCEVMRFNDGKLPTKRLETLLISNKCST